MKNSEIKKALRGIMPTSIRDYDKISDGKYASQYGNRVILGYDQDLDISISIGVFHGKTKTYKFKIEVCGDTKMHSSCSEDRIGEFLQHFILTLGEFREHLLLFHRRCRLFARGDFMTADSRQVKISSIL